MCINCPTFKVDFQGGGRVDYDCTSGCPVPGVRYYSVPAQRFTALVQAFDKEHFFDIPRTDPHTVFDAPVFRLTYRDSTSIHEVVDDSRENASLTRREDLFRTAIDADRFRRPSVGLYRSLVNSGWDVDTVAEDQQNALTSAAAYKDLLSAQFLIQRGSVATAKAIENAAMNDNLELFRLVLPTSRMPSDRQLAANAAISAARSRNPELLRYLLDSGVPPNQREPVNGLTPLLNAIHNNQIENTILLLDRGANANIGDIAGRTPLWYAARFTNRGFTQVLVQHGAIVDGTTN